jgi:hypothetical protein
LFLFGILPFDIFNPSNTMALYETNSENLTKITQTTFEQVGLRERTDLQRLIKKQIEVISPDTLVIAEEFGEWEESKRRIDLLGLDKDANLVVIELKRTEDGGHMELQAIRYSAMVSRMTFEKVVDIYARYLVREGSSEDAQSEILDFLGWDEPDEDLFAQDVRIVLVSSNFSKELTTAVMWLNERDLDIRCIRIIPYFYNERTLTDVQQVIPLPEAAEYQIQIRQKEQKERIERVERKTQYYKFWENLLELGKEKTDLHGNVTPSNRDYLTIKSPRGVRLLYIINQYDGRVEFYIDKGDTELNKKIYDNFQAHQQEIDAVFGEGLSWERRDEGKGCRIAYYFKSGGYKSDESEWQVIHSEMINAMTRLDNALSPFISNYAQNK